MRPADCLLGLQLSPEWRVVELVSRPPNATGGFFSVGYFVQRADGHRAFLKALDFSAALQSGDPARALQQMTTAYNFERDLLNACRDKRLRRISTPIADGMVTVPGPFGPLANVCYLIFESAQGTVRDEMQKLSQFDLAWCLRSLHHAAVGIQQLHSAGIAHQDLKPSNVLVFPGSGSKLADLGRASSVHIASPHDDAPMPGDSTYAPLDSFYPGTSRDFMGRCMADLYLLGSLFFSYFTGLSATATVLAKTRGLDPAAVSTGTFTGDLPYFQQAFHEAILDFEAAVTPVAGNLTSAIVLIVERLCDPDPAKRGDPRLKGTLIPHYNIERFVSQLTLLTGKAEAGLM